MVQRRLNLRLFSLLTIAISSVPSVGYAVTIYVAITGSDTTGDGSTAHPYKTIQKGASVSGPGDTVTVRAGSYAGFIVGWDPPNNGIYSVIAGTAQAPITVQADPAAAAGSVIINASNSKTARRYRFGTRLRLHHYRRASTFRARRSPCIPTREAESRQPVTTT